MQMQGDAVTGHLHFCEYCFGILTSDRWLGSNMNPPTLRNVRTGVFNGEQAGYKCPTCQGEMVKGPVATADGSSIEVDGCLKCGSLWFDNREIEPFIPEIKDILPDARHHSPISWGERIVGLASALTFGARSHERKSSDNTDIFKLEKDDSDQEE
jgi:Zn-finger nucleic acid-binding protein